MAGRVLAWVRLGRPLFLPSGLAFFALGALMARASGHALDWPTFLLGQGLVTTVQLGVHYANEWHDLAADRANASPTWLAGGSRVLVQGALAPRVALHTSRILFGAAVILLAAVAALHGPQPAALGAAMLVLAWAYSAPPLRLHSTGFGEAAAAVVVALLVPGLALALAGAAASPETAWSLGPLVAHLFATVVVLSLPDVAGDAGAGKRTLAVRVGPRGAGRIAQAAWVLAGLATLWTLSLGRPPYVAAAAGAGLALAIAFPVLAGQRRWNVLAVLAAGLAALQLAVTAGPLLP